MGCDEPQGFINAVFEFRSKSRESLIVPVCCLIELRRAAGERDGPYLRLSAVFPNLFPRYNVSRIGLYAASRRSNSVRLASLRGTSRCFAISSQIRCTRTICSSIGSCPTCSRMELVFMPFLALLIVVRLGNRQLSIGEETDSILRPS